MSLAKTAAAVAKCLAASRQRVVLAESCTAGLVSAALARSAGVSEWHCGSSVTYRSPTKVAWLGLSDRAIRRHGAVSATVARQMAVNILARTAEADLSASVTGHLGPHAPAGLDGVIFVGVARRQNGTPRSLSVRRFQLAQTTRRARQQEAAELVLSSLLDALQENRPPARQPT